MKHPDAVAGILLLAFCVLAYAATARFAEVPAMLSQNVPPTFFPRLVLAVVAVLSLILVARSRRAPAVRTERVPGKVWVSAGIVAASAVASAGLGILVTVGLAAAVLPPVWGERRIARIAALALGLPAALYLVFGIVLGVRFPAGRLLEAVL